MVAICVMMFRYIKEYTSYLVIRTLTLLIIINSNCGSCYTCMVACDVKFK